MSRIAFEFTLFGKHFSVAWYAIFVTGGMIGALILLAYLMSRRKDEYTIDDALEVFLFTIPFAVIFARLGYALPRINSFNSFWEFWDLSKGGLTIVVGIPGGALGILIYCLIRKKSIFRVFDLIIPCLLLGQIVGRWGNYVNQELFGLPITNPALQFFPFGVYISGQVGVADGWYCANFFYESFLNFIALVVVLVLMLKMGDKLKVGTISIGYVIWYGVLRGLLEFVKIGQLKWGNVRVIQLICFVLSAIGVVVMILLQKGIIKFETEKMRKAHFITTSVDDEIMSNNYNYDVATSFVIRDEGDDVESDNEDVNQDE